MTQLRSVIQNPETLIGLERIQYRVSLARRRDEFALKGALLREPWTGTFYRATRDADSAKAERITIEELRSHVLAGDEFDDLQARAWKR